MRLPPKMLVTATMAEPSVLPLSLRGCVCLGLHVPTLHQKPPQRDEAQAYGGLLPVVDQQSEHGHAQPTVSLEEITYRRAVIDDGAA